jgi:hypothetical protein
MVKVKAPHAGYPATSGNTSNLPSYASFPELHFRVVVRVLLFQAKLTVRGFQKKYQFPEYTATATFAG